MKTHFRILNAFFLVALVTGCAEPDPIETGSTPQSVCRQISKLSREAQRDAFALDLAPASAAFQRIIALYDKVPPRFECGVEMSPAAARIHQALVFSNQRYFLLADGVFDKAQTLLSDGSTEQDLKDRALMTSYRALHELNRRNPVVAGDLGLQTIDNVARLERSFAGLDGESDVLDVDRSALRDVMSWAQALYAVGSTDLLGEGSDGACRQDSLVRARSAIDLVKALKNPAVEGRFRLLAARALACDRDWAAARSEAEKAADLLQNSVRNTPLHAHALFLLGSVLVAQNDPKKALEVFDAGIVIYREEPSGVQYDAAWPYIQLITGLRARSEDPMSKAEYDRRVFEIAQLVRGSLTGNDIASAAVSFEAGSSDAADAVQRWRAAEKEIADLFAIKAQAERLYDDLGIDLDAQLASALEQEQKLRDIRDEIAPEFSRVLVVPLDLSQIQTELKADEAAVQILTGQGTPPTLLLVDKTEVTVVFPQVRSADLSKAVSVLSSSVTADDDGNVPPFEAGISALLYQALFAEIEDKLKSKSRLFFSTNGVLQKMPLEMLVTTDLEQASAFNDDDYRSLDWFGDDLEISYIPSPRNLVDIRLRFGASSAKRDVMVMGDLEANDTVQGLMTAASLPSGCENTARQFVSLGNLEGARREVQDIQQIFGAQTGQLTGPSFTKENILQSSASGELKDFQIIHFATHGALWENVDCFTEPALKTSVGPDGSSDGMLKTSEIRNLSLDAQLIVLAACEAIGTIGDRSLTTGENLQGLARAFFAGGGTRSVIAGHWRISDAVTQQTMRLVYQNLKATPEISFGTALRNAQRMLRTGEGLDVGGSNGEFSHPFFWAPLVLIGDGNTRLVRSAPT